MSDTELGAKQHSGEKQPAAAAPKSAGHLVFICLCLVALLAGAGVPMLLTGDAGECYIEELFGMADPSGAVEG